MQAHDVIAGFFYFVVLLRDLVLPTASNNERVG